MSPEWLQSPHSGHCCLPINESVSNNLDRYLVKYFVCLGAFQRLPVRVSLCRHSGSARVKSLNSPGLLNSGQKTFSSKHPLAFPWILALSIL